MKKIMGVILAAILAAAAQAAELSGEVVGISDGDTITLLDDGQHQHKVRLAGIDAPEKSQPFGQASKQHLSDLIYHARVTVRYDKTDRYGRTIGTIFHQGQDINIKQIQAGLAWHYKAYEREQPVAERLRYAKAEEAARVERRGLWSDLLPTAPWEYRRDH